MALEHGEVETLQPRRALAKLIGSRGWRGDEHRLLSRREAAANCVGGRGDESLPLHVEVVQVERNERLVAQWQQLLRGLGSGRGEA